MAKRILLVFLLSATAGLSAAGTASASHIPGMPCSSCADHSAWPSIDGLILRADGPATYVGTPASDQLMGHHGSDVLKGMGGSDVIWGDYDPFGQPATQVDRIRGGGGTDFIYGSHGRNVIFGGRGNDAISVHYGRGFVDCGPGRDIYHVARTRERGYTFRNCEKVDYRPEQIRGGGLRPLR